MDRVMELNAIAVEANATKARQCMRTPAAALSENCRAFNLNRGISCVGRLFTQKLPSFRQPVEGNSEIVSRASCGSRRQDARAPSLPKRMAIGVNRRYL